MSKKMKFTFSGQVNALLSDEDAWKITQAVAVLEKLAREGKIEYRTGRVRAREEATKEKPPKPFKPSPQQARILEGMKGRDWTSMAEMEGVIDIPYISLGPHLSKLTQEGFLERQARERDQASNLGHMTMWVYRLSQTKA